jgi:histidinol-phosphate/aromatic aminotransferase/cobyric acid decarboxylase-like protein
MEVHGGVTDGEAARLGIDAAAVLDFSANVNPRGPSPAVLRAIRDAPVDRYPDPHAAALRARVGATVGRDAAEVVIGAGATDLLWTLARVLCGPGRPALVVEPTFSELRCAAEGAGAAVAEWRARPEEEFAVDLEAVARAAEAARARAVYLCAPNNPTGAATPAAAVVALADRLRGATLVLDESFLPVSDRHADLAAPMPANVVRVRSLTKAHAIPGVRVGYALAPAPLAARLERARPPWSAGAHAQAAGAAALADEGRMGEIRAAWLADRDALALRLRALGLAPLPSAAPFLLLPVPGAAALRARLLERHRILVRSCGSFGLPDHVRLCARPAPDVERLAAALVAERDLLGTP